MSAEKAPKFVSAAPQIRLVNAFAEPYNNAIAAARTCYSSHLVLPEEVAKDDKARARREAIAQSTYAAGHHTVWQHATFQFTLANVSRQLVWSFLHAHPHYNSEQVSQRYVAVQADQVIIPNLPEPLLTLYRNTVAAQMKCYQSLVRLLEGPVTEAYFAIFPARRKHAKDFSAAVRKKAQEIARYALPIGTYTFLYHTVSGLTLHRYHRLCRMLDVPAETELVVTAMVKAVDAVDPLFFRAIEDPIELEQTHEYRALAASAALERGGGNFIREFDAQMAGATSLLVDTTPLAESLVARSVRQVLGLSAGALDDTEAIRWVTDPRRNRDLSGPLDLTSMGKINRALHHPHYTFQKKLSHTADSQDQRHRSTPGTRPVTYAHYAGGEPDVIVPPLIRQQPEAQDCFLSCMTDTWRTIDQLLQKDVAPEMALYLLPNAFPIRFLESGDLMAFRHKWVTRLCYNAQEEIWRAACEEVEQARLVHPRLLENVGPPCAVRSVALSRPICPEGSRYCGVPVWKISSTDWKREI